jgi:hypothetical protein
MQRLFNAAHNKELVIISVKCDVKIKNDNFTAFEGDHLKCYCQDDFSRSLKQIEQTINLAEDILKQSKEEITNDKITIKIDLNGNFEKKEISAEFHDLDSYKQFLIAENMMIARRYEMK